VKAATSKTDNLSQSVGSADVAQLKRDISQKYEELCNKAKVCDVNKLSIGLLLE
jgi:hypothetical protein